MSGYGAAFMERHGVVALEERADVAVVGAARTPDDALLRTLRAFHRRPVSVRRLDAVELRLRMQRSLLPASVTVVTAGGSRDVRLSELHDDAHAVNLTNSLLARAATWNASDLHLESRRHGFEARCRVDGVMRSVGSFAAEVFPSVAARLKVLAGVGSDRRPQDGRFTALLGDRPFDVRLSSIPTVRGESISLRLLPADVERLSIDELGMDDASSAQLRDAVARPSGLVVVAGPTGSGKTTTLHAALRSIAGERRRILTIEDPVEYRLEGVSQLQVNDGSGLTFDELLRRALRQDPDVIMVGEIRDGLTARLAVRAALTGHLILTTVHAASTAGALNRIVELGASRSLIESLPLLLLSQRLVRTVCPDCVRMHAPTDSERRLFQAARAPLPARLAGGDGCASCGGTGYRGRTAIVDLRDAARSDAGGLVRAGVEKVKRGVTTAVEVVWAIGG